MDEVVKRCSKCGEVKSVELFSFSKRAEKRLQSSCKVYRHRITEEMHEAMGDAGIEPANLPDVSRTL